jgi:flagellar hook-associated protein 3 FlgL
MRVTFNSSYNALSDRLNSLNSMQQKAQQQLATGQKLTTAADDPTAMQRVLELRTDKAKETQFWQNAGDVTSISKASTSDLQQLESVSTRMGELTTLGSSELNGTTNFSAYASETDQLLEQALTQANSQLNGKYLHGGTATNTPPFVAVRDANNKITSINYAGNSTDAQVRVSESSTVCPYSSGAENTNIRDLLNNMVALRDGLQAGSASTVAALTPAQGAVEDLLLSSISRAGSIQYRLGVSQSQSTQRFTGDENLISRDADVDFAEATIRLNRAQTAYSAAVQSGAKIASTSLLNYIN